MGTREHYTLESKREAAELFLPPTFQG